MKKHVFNAGPCILPQPAIESAIAAIKDFDGTGVGLLEISHRTPGWERIMAETEQLWRDLLHIPDTWMKLFANILVIIANYVFSKLFVFRPSRRS